MFSELNSQVKTVRDGVEIDNMEYKKLREFIGKEIPVDGFFINNGGMYGPSVTVIGCGCKINMPKRAVKQFEEIKGNAELLNAVLEGHLKITDIKTQATKLGVAVVYTLTDC